MVVVGRERVHFTTKEIIVCKGRAIAFFSLSGIWEKGAFYDTKHICYKGRDTAVFYLFRVVVVGRERVHFTTKEIIVRKGRAAYLTYVTYLTYLHYLLTYLTYLLGGFYKFIPSMGG